tara:strand:+ start:347 stop:520 length:174 start_codon:yes stop_codon:yes gene_type:complete
MSEEVVEKKKVKKPVKKKSGKCDFACIEACLKELEGSNKKQHKMARINLRNALKLLK